MSTTKPLLNAFARALLDNEQLVLVSDAPGKAAGKADAQASVCAAVSFQANIESLGFGFTKQSFERLTEMPVEDQARVYAQAWPALRENAGAHKSFAPMYPNFPKQVIEAEEAELFVNAMVHYLGHVVGFRFMPDYPVEKRPKLREKTAKPKALEIIGPEAAIARLGRWLESTQAWSPTQVAGVRAGLSWMAQEGLESGTLTQLIKLLDKATWPNRENKATVVGWWMETARQAKARGDADPASSLAATFESAGNWPFDPMTPTDVLRAAVAMSDGDVSLAENSKFNSFPRSQRRMLMGALDRGIPKTATAEEDVFNRRETFLRLGERLHPGEFERDYPNAFALFDAVRNKSAPVSLMGRLDKALSAKANEKSVETVAALFEERPGALARQLHRILAWAGNKHEHAMRIIGAFDEVADRCGTGLLLTVAHHFAQDERKVRTVMPKGKLGKIRMTETLAKPVRDDYAAYASVGAENALLRRFAKLPGLGKCYVEDALDDVPTPYAMRSAAKALQTVPRGAKLPLGENEEITRLFLWWSESDPKGVVPNTERIDIDLSCVVLDDKFKVVSTCSYFDLRGKGLTHSGDIVSAPKGACEFIDIEHERLPQGARYVVMSINSYSQQNYADVPECFAGWMARKKANKGEIFEPRTVKNRFDLTAETKGVMPMMLDLKHGHAMWLDMPYVNDGFSVNNVLAHDNKLRRIVEGFANLERPTMGLLFKLHAKARGELVRYKKDADTVFSLAPQSKKPGVNAYELATITSDWMAEDQGGQAVPAPTKKQTALKR